MLEREENFLETKHENEADQRELGRLGCANDSVTLLCFLGCYNPLSQSELTCRNKIIKIYLWNTML